MAHDARYGYHSGPIAEVECPVDSSTGTIEVGYLVTLATAGYVKAATSGDEPYGWAMSRCTAPTNDGDKTIRVNVSREAIYRLPPASGSVAQSNLFLAKDVGGSQSVDTSANTDKSIEIVGVDVPGDFYLVRIAPTLS